MLGGKNKKVKHLTATVAEQQSTTELITQELYKKNLELAHTNRTLSLLRRVDEMVLHPDTTIESLANGIAEAVVASSTYSMCALFVRAGDDELAPFFLKGYSFVEIPTPHQLEIELARFRLQPRHPLFRGQNKSEVLSIERLDNVIKSQLFGGDAHVIDDIVKLTITKSFCLVKLMARGQTVGVLLVGMLEKSHEVTLEERALLERLSEAVGVAIDNKLLFEQNQKVLRKLKQSNDKLKALDQAKDEFISMASHQLRTPLTSVKGYLSMLAEGDAGKLNKDQGKFVDQAFVSSQRMVYLIADLLNVSRLKTGKFIIEAKPTYLPDVVETEIAQLYETVKARGLTMEYKKPAKFTSLMLDEIKIRQVIMNFADNAIYYTPKGKIEIKLIEKPKTIVFTVSDSGIGVPKKEQHHLFTKFYRAGNARSARPDGTGLGLFMAKKVIVAQGGSIIFSTTEGKGSTFGFSFEKEKLAVPKDAKISTMITRI